MDKLKVAASFLKSKFTKDELDEKLTEAVSDENWQASTQLLHQISNASFNYESQQRIIVFIWEKIKHKNWKKVLKTLHLVDFLIKYGPTSLIDNFKENVYEFRKLDDYTNMSDGIDRGESVRKQAKVLLLLLTDDNHLNDERAKAKQIKERMSTVIGSGAYFGNFSNEPKTSSSEFKGSSYGSINSESFKYAPQPSKGLSFGESVMKELYDKKKSVSPDQTPPPPPQPASGLNIQNMIQKKSEKKIESPAKKSFNSLNMKLVKPPQKKTGEKPVQKPVQKPSNKPEVVQKPQKKEESKINIMDFDFGAAITEPTASSSPLDFLGSSSSPPQPQTGPSSFNFLGSTVPQAASTPAQQVAPKNDLMGLGSFNLQSFPSSSGQLTQPSSNQANHSVGVSLQGVGQVSVQNNLNWGFNSPGSQVASQSLNLSLNMKPQVKAAPKDENSLIDFSNFRQELESLEGKGKEEKITSTWNW